MNLILCNVSDAGVGVGWPLRLVCLVRRYIWTPAVNGVSDVYLMLLMGSVTSTWLHMLISGQRHGFKGGFGWVLLLSTLQYVLVLS